MRADEQIVFTAGNAPLRGGRAIWFRRDDMEFCVGETRFHHPLSNTSTMAIFNKTKPDGE